MNFRWTIKELETFTNKRMIQGLITERKAGLNPYAPLYVRLTKLSHWVEKHVRG